MGSQNIQSKKILFPRTTFGVKNLIEKKGFGSKLNMFWGHKKNFVGLQSRNVPDQKFYPAMQKLSETKRIRKDENQKRKETVNY